MKATIAEAAAASPLATALLPVSAAYTGWVIGTEGRKLALRLFAPAPAEPRNLWSSDPVWQRCNYDWGTPAGGCVISLTDGTPFGFPQDPAFVVSWGGYFLRPGSGIAVSSPSVIATNDYGQQFATNSYGWASVSEADGNDVWLHGVDVPRRPATVWTLDQAGVVDYDLTVVEGDDSGPRPTWATVATPNSPRAPQQLLAAIDDAVTSSPGFGTWVQDRIITEVTTDPSSPAIEFPGWFEHWEDHGDEFATPYDDPLEYWRDAADIVERGRGSDPAVQRCLRGGDDAEVFYDSARDAIVVVKDGKIVTFFVPDGDSYGYWLNECSS